MNMLEKQQELERIYDKNQTNSRIREYFKEQATEEFYQVLVTHNLSEVFVLSMLTQMVLHKRATVPTLVGCLRHHCSNDQEVADTLERCVAAGFLHYADKDHQFIIIWDIPSELQHELDKFQYPLPMVVPPRIVTTNTDTGYITQKGSVILRDNHTLDDVVLDHLNRLNQIPLTINLETARTIQNKWKGLDRMHPGESWEDFQKRRRAFEKYDSVSKDIMELVGNKFFFTHKYDKRGRTYCSGFHINYQGTEWNKAVIELAESEELND